MITNNVTCPSNVRITMPMVCENKDTKAFLCCGNQAYWRWYNDVNRIACLGLTNPDFPHCSDLSTYHRLDDDYVVDAV